MKENFKKVLFIAREMGIGWVSYRLLYELRRKSGAIRRRFPPSPAPTADCLGSKLLLPYTVDLSVRHWRVIAHSCPWYQSMPTIGASIPDPGEVIREADKAVEGKIRFFSRWEVDLGNPVDWLRNPKTGKRISIEKHWTEIPDLDQSQGDIKYYWEPSRFSYAFTLVRAYACTGNEKYADAFWSHFEEWVTMNPPELGPNWKCGQEISLRIIAWAFAAQVFVDCDSTTEDRLVRLFSLLDYMARHVERHFEFALKSVRNNHSISEAAGMFTVGLLCPFLKGADRWREEGLKHLQNEVLWQVYEDGTYVQHSMIYERLVAEVLVWCIQLGRIGGVSFREDFLAKTNKILRFLNSLIDSSGRVPNYGSNDGTQLFRLHSCDYLDFRPALQTLSCVLNRKKIFSEGPWDEEAQWLFGPTKNLTTHSPEKAACFPDGGYYVLENSEAKGLIRCATYKNRPGQADMLHFDLNWRGQNLLTDAGSYSYNPEACWGDYFSGTSSHNTVTVDEHNQMKRERFTWYDWTKSRVLSFTPGQMFVGEHYSYRPVIHRRVVLSESNIWVVIDDLFGDSRPHDFRLHWLVGEKNTALFEHGLIIESSEGQTLIEFWTSVPCERSLVVGQMNPPRGWRSLYYGEVEEIPSLLVKTSATSQVRLITCIYPGSSCSRIKLAKLGRGEELFAGYRLADIGSPQALLKEWDKP